MSIIRMHEVTTLTPEQFVAGVTDFGPGRQEIFPNSADGDLRVHSQGPGRADVTEGKGGIWERLEYDWSDPARVVMRTVDSNLWGGASGHTYTLTRRPDGSTAIDAVTVRDGKNLRGKLLGGLIGSVGRGVLVKAFHQAVTQIEARNGIVRP